MIGKLKGKLSELDGNIAFIETSGGVFYKVFLPPKIILKNKIKDEIEIYTYLQVREDNLTLFGFENKKQFHLFEMLLSVDGIGPKSAFNIISFADTDNILEAAAHNNLDFFNSIPGIGKKTAQKILLELSSQLKKPFDLTSIVLSQDDILVVDALVSLGFKKFESTKIVIKLGKKLSVEDKIKEAIIMMSKK